MPCSHHVLPPDPRRTARAALAASSSPSVAGSGTGTVYVIVKLGAIAGLLFAAAPSFDQNPRNDVGLDSRLSLLSNQPSFGFVPFSHD
jgi:hypothetical protein